MLLGSKGGPDYLVYIILYLYLFLTFSASLSLVLFPHICHCLGSFHWHKQLTAEPAASIVTILCPAEQEETTPDRTPSRGFSIYSTLASSPDQRTKYPCCIMNVLSKDAIRSLHFSPETLDHDDFSLGPG